MLAVAVTSYSMLQSLVVPVLSRIQVEYDTDQTTVTWVLTAYLLSASICTPLIGRVGDALGKTRILVVTMVVLVLGTLAAALAPGIGWLIGARVVQGVGGGVLPLAFGIVRDEFGEKVGGVLASLSSLLAVGYGLGLVVAGPIVNGLGYRWLFWLPMIVTAIATVAALVLLPPSRREVGDRLPLLPAALLSASLVALLLALSEGNVWGWVSPAVIGLVVVSAVAGLAWVAAERRAPVPMIDLVMLRQRGVWTSNAVGACLGFGMFACFGFLPQMLQTPESSGYGFGATISESGFLILPSPVASFLVGFTIAPLVARVGARVITSVGIVVAAASFVVLALWHAEPWQILVATAMQGAGSGLVFATLAGVVIAAVPPRQSSVASGMNANVRTVGGAIGAAVMAGVVTHQLEPSGLPVEHGYTVGFVVLALVTLTGVGAAVLIPRQSVARKGSHWQDAADAELGLLAAAPAPYRDRSEPGDEPAKVADQEVGLLERGEVATPRHGRPSHDVVELRRDPP